MAAPNPAFGVVGGELLPFTPVLPDTGECFKFEITLVSAEFKTQGSAAAALHPSVAAASSASDSRDTTAVECSSAAVPSPSCEAAAPKTKKKKPADSSVYALPASSKKSAAFASVVPGVSPERKIAVSLDATVADAVEWPEGSCVAVFEQNFKEVKQPCDEAEARKWQREELEMSVFQGKASKDGFIKDPANKKALGSVTVNLADFVSTAQPGEEFRREVTLTAPPHNRFSLTFRIKASPVSRQPAPAAHDPAARVHMSPKEIVSSANSRLGNAQKGRELRIKLDPHCSFTAGTHIGIAVEEAWREKGVMLMHKLSKFEACDPGAANYFGQVTCLQAAAGCAAMRIKCPEISTTKNDKTIQESRFGWRLLSTCSSALKERLDTRSAPYSSFDLQNEPIFCLFPSSKAAEAEDEVVKQDEVGAKATARAAARTRAISEIAVKKAEVERMAAQPVRMSHDQLGMMRLRQGFLIAQPLVSDAVKRLFTEWYPDPENTKCKDACARVLGSSEGPWDIFTIVNGLLFKPSMFQRLAERFGVNSTEKDSEKCKLEWTLVQIYAVRNWWAHVQVTVANCRQALLAITDFIAMLPPELKAGESDRIMSDLDGIISSISQPHAQSLSMSVDDMAYFYFGCACRHLSHVGTSLLKEVKSLAFCTYLQRQIDAKKAKFRQRQITVRQSSVTEVGDVTRALLALYQDHLLPPTIHVDSSSFNFDCEIIRTVRNHFAHAPESGNSVILVLLALGSLSRIISVVFKTCLHQAEGDAAAVAAVHTIQDDAEHLCTEISDWQSVLLQKAGVLDTKALVGAVCQSYQDVLVANDYKQFADDDFKRLRLLVKGEIVGSAPVPSFASKLEGTNRSRERSILNFVARVPPAAAECVESAVEWLVAQARGQNLHMQSAVSFFKNEMLLQKADGSVLDAACSDDAHVSRQGKQELAKFLHTCGRDLLEVVGAPCGMQQCSGWEALLHASAFVLNNQEWLSVPSSFEPKFHACVLVQGLTREDLLSRCTKVLRPLLNAAVSDVYAADGILLNIEHVFHESEFFDCLSHLAALASQQLGAFPRSSSVTVKVIDTEQAGLSATVTSHILTGREIESKHLEACLHPVFTLDDSASHCKFVLLHGIPGTGKSALSDSALGRLDTTFKEHSSSGASGEAVEEYSYKIQARGRDSVRDGLHKMGLSLCSKLGIGSAASFEDVLGSDLKPPRLRQFLQTQRFVILADDADEDGLRELLLHVPRSYKPCAVIVTSQYGELLIPRIHQSDRKDDFVAIELKCFQPHVSLMLVEAVCSSGKYVALRSEMQSWLTQVLEQLGQLPLAVRVFAEWLQHELTLPLPEGAVFDFAILQTRWQVEYDQDDGDDDGMLGAVVGSRGLRATVRLALHNLHKFKSPEEYEASEQVLGLLALCRPVKVPWSLFDGGSKGEARQLVRGARVQVAGDSLEFVSPVGERCQVTCLKSDKAVSKANRARKTANEQAKQESRSLVYDERYTGVIKSVHGTDLGVQLLDKTANFDFNCVTSEQGDFEMKDKRCMLHLATFAPVVGSECYSSSNGVKGVIRSSVIRFDSGNHPSVDVVPHSIASFAVFRQFLSRHFFRCSCPMFAAFMVAFIQAFYGWTDWSLGLFFVMLHLHPKSFSALLVFSVFISDISLFNAVFIIIPLRYFMNFLSQRFDPGQHHFCDVRSIINELYVRFFCFFASHHRQRNFASFAVLLSIAVMSPSVSAMGFTFDLWMMFPAFLLWYLMSAMCRRHGCESALASLCTRILLRHDNFVFVWSFNFYLTVLIFVAKFVYHVWGKKINDYNVPLADLKILNHEPVIHNGHLCFKKTFHSKHYACNGRVLQRHVNGSVSVVFGCETGALSALKPGAEVKRFKAGSVRVRGVDGVAAAVQGVEGLKRVAAALRSSGLVQVDEEQRTFAMHQMLQQAVGRVLGWGQQCERMRQLLHTRCGQFGDEDDFDVGLYAVMREVAEAALAAVERVKEEGGETADAWCSGLLLRLYDVAREVYGTGAEFPNRVCAAAHSSLVGDFLRELVMTKGCTSAGRSMTLRQLVDASPHLRDVVARNPDFKPDEGDVRAVQEEMANGASMSAALCVIQIRRFNLEKCLRLQWERRWRALLLAGLVRALVGQAGGTSVRMQEVAATALVQELVGLGNERDLGQLLRKAAGLRVVGDDVMVEAKGVAEAAVGWSDDGGASAAGRGLRAMRWRLGMLKGNTESYEKMMDEIGGVHEVEAEAGYKWAAGVALGAACDRVGYSYQGPETQDLFEKAIAAYERALIMRLDTLGEQHPASAATLNSMGTAYSMKGNDDMAIMLYERALRISDDTLGQHPFTATIIGSMGASYSKKGEQKRAIALYKQALRIFERTVGRMHCDAADVIFGMSTTYCKLGDFVKAEEEVRSNALNLYERMTGRMHTDAIYSISTAYSHMVNPDFVKAEELGVEALRIYEETLGRDHKEAKKARDNLLSILKVTRRGI